MNLLKKARAAISVARTEGVVGVASHLQMKLKQSPARDLFGTQPMFRYATCNDLVRLMARYPQYCLFDRDSDRSAAWGLKAVGNLFCADRIVRFEPKRVLEVGAGWSCHFDKHFGPDLDYWLIDDAHEIGGCRDSEEWFEQAIRKRQNTRFVRGLLGSFLPELPDQTFDLVFSISVIEHVQFDQKRSFYQDMYRVLKPGGIIAHSIDIPATDRGQAEFECISQAGFLIPKRPEIVIRVTPSEGDPTLFEDLHSVFHGYLGIGRPDKWDELKTVRCHYSTILVFGRKPMAQQPDRTQLR